jgi:DNA-directed RNA polymerase specialized sigma24 family protein
MTISTPRAGFRCPGELLSLGLWHRVQRSPNFLTVQQRSRLHFDVEVVERMAREAAEEESLSESRLDALRICLREFSERQQLILQQCYAGTETITEVAQQLGRNP